MSFTNFKTFRTKPGDIRAGSVILLDDCYLRSCSQRETPRINTIRIKGAAYPVAAELSDVIRGPFDTVEGGSVAWRLTCPIVRRTGADEREVQYLKSIVLDAERRNTHIVFWGLTGSGKSTRGMQNLLISDLEAGRVIVSQSLKGEDFEMCRAYCLQHDLPLVYVDLNDPVHSAAFNPLATDNPSEAINAIVSFVDLNHTKESRDSEFWRQNGISFLTGAWHAGYRSFPALYKLFAQSPQEICTALSGADHPAVRSTIAFLRSGSNNADTVLATIVGWLERFDHPDISRLTGTQELDPKKLFAKPGVVYIRAQEADLPTTRSIYNILLQWLLQQSIKFADAAIKDPNRPRVSFYIDDLPAWGLIPCLPDQMATLRSREICVIAAVQSMAHLRSTYGNATAETLEKSFVNKVLLPGIDQLDAEYFSRYTGEQTVGYLTGFASGFDNFTSDRYVLSANDIRASEWHHFLFGRPLTFILRDVCFQAYVCPSYHRPDVLELLGSSAGKLGLVPRANPLPENSPSTPPPKKGAGSTADGSTGYSFTNTAGWTNEQIQERINHYKRMVDFAVTTGSALNWWLAFEEENKHRLPLVLRLVEEMAMTFSPPCTIAEFFLAFVYGNSDNIAVTLAFARYRRLKKEADERAAQLKKTQEQPGVTIKPVDPASIEKITHPSGKPKRWLNCPHCAAAIGPRAKKCHKCHKLIGKIKPR